MSLNLNNSSLADVKEASLILLTTFQMSLLTDNIIDDLEELTVKFLINNGTPEKVANVIYEQTRSMYGNKADFQQSIGLFTVWVMSSVTFQSEQSKVEGYVEINKRRNQILENVYKILQDNLLEGTPLGFEGITFSKDFYANIPIILSYISKELCFLNELSGEKLSGKYRFKIRKEAFNDLSDKLKD